MAGEAAVHPQWPTFKGNNRRTGYHGDVTTNIKYPGEALPTDFALGQNYPNPFNPSTTIRYELPGNSDVRLEVYDMLGRRVALLVNETRQAGTHQVVFDASTLSSGVYVYRLQTGGFVQTRKMLLIR